MSKNDVAWDKFFRRTTVLADIRAKGYCYVSADDLKRFGEREPRLMAKLDTIGVCPKVFREYKLTIFPVRNGQYILFSDPEQRTYFAFGADGYALRPEVHRSSVDLSSYDSYPGSQDLNESQAIDFAHLTGLLQRFTNEEALHLTIRGRTYSGRFGFRLPFGWHHVDVESVQIEVDSGYESPSAIYLIEAKLGRRDDFNIRQLYYPFLEWGGRSAKRIVPLFLTYTNGIYTLTEFEFASRFGELAAVRSGSYLIDETPTLPVNLMQALASTPQETEPQVPYPQANDLDKVIDVVSSVDRGINDKGLMGEYFEFDERQGDYYANAASYLGFLDRSEHSFTMTGRGRALLDTKSRQERTRILLDQMCRRPSLREVLHLLASRGYELAAIGNDEIAEIIRRHTGLSGATVGRRASTVRSWLTWLLHNTTVLA
jgi:hypothetical protein